MTKPITTIAEKLRVVEDLIVSLRPFRFQRHLPGHQTYEVLKEIARDYRAREVGEASITIREVERKLQAARDMRLDRGRLCALLDEVLARWPVIRQALERELSPDPEGQADHHVATRVNS